MPTNPERSMRRKERYDYLIKLGFTATQARAMRDNSGIVIETKVKAERRRINRKRRPTPQETQRRQNIEAALSTTTLAARNRRFESRGNRRADFSMWSGKEGFPDWALERIASYNKAKGRNPFDAFGYRRFYYWYVERIADFENEFYADRGDSEIRNARNLPLRKNIEISRPSSRTA